MSVGPATLDIVCTVYRDEKTLRSLAEAVDRGVAPLRMPWRLILVSDGSPDRSWAIMEALATERTNVTAIELSRNFGQHVAVSAGLDFSDADFVVVLDSDLQDPPEVIPTIVDLLRSDRYDIVYTRRASRSEALPRRFSSWLFWSGLRALLGPRLVRNQLMLRGMNRRWVVAFRALGERHRFVGGLSAWLGFRQTELVVEPAAGQRGSSTYRLLDLATLATDAAISLSIVPLRIASALGCAAMVFASGYGLWILWSVLTGQLLQPGFASVVTLIAGASGVQLLLLGVIGEYLGRTLRETQQRPLYLIREVVGVGAADRAADDPLPPHDLPNHR